MGYSGGLCLGDIDAAFMQLFSMLNFKNIYFHEAGNGKNIPTLLDTTQVVPNLDKCNT